MSDAPSDRWTVRGVSRADQARIRRLAADMGVSQGELIRRALDALEADKSGGGEGGPDVVSDLLAAVSDLEARMAALEAALARRPVADMADLRRRLRLDKG